MHNSSFLLAQEMQACEDELARQEAEREKARRKEVSTPTESVPTPSSAASSQTYERPPYKGERTVVTSSGSKEKKCTIS
ncbi:hypothetical protein OESDEN_20764 [Oesophagostomum dentatum]|uniref:Uncharacterized protein n=1 Tax=Oesophagostomum dentatum TaxID=61180 RepID=A0A0B1S3T9_OESDE|nr:hypothetical protein OESDEN_20764 [Oesophagostomum dentatum]